MGGDEPTPESEVAAESTRGPGTGGWQTRLLILGVGLAAVAALLWPRGANGPRAGGFLLDAESRQAPLSEQLAPVTLLHFWATWCPPCIDEVPALDRLARDLAGEPGFRVLMVAVADDREQVKRFAGAAPERVLYDPEWEVAHRYGTRQLPETHLLVDGKVVKSFVGAQDWDQAPLRDVIRGALAQVAQGG
jgi:thiol-disulfide isomerase/thioredoxin